MEEILCVLRGGVEGGTIDDSGVVGRHEPFDLDCIARRLRVGEIGIGGRADI